MKTLRLLLISCFLINISALVAQSVQPNIIMIALDDQNDYTEGFDGNPQVETPNIKRLEQLGTLFYNAYTAAPQCGPSRAAMITGKDVAYTQIYNNPDYRCKNMADNFTPAKGNAEFYTIPQYLKDNAGYFTYQLNKVMHCYENGIDYDSITADICAKEFSWNKIFIYSDSTIIDPIGNANLEGPKQFAWAKLDNSLEPALEDYVMTDSAIAFLNAYAADASIACNKPLFLGLGYLKPHLPYFIPEKYFNGLYEDLYAEPFDKPYNFPYNAYPYNGLIMPPQPAVPYSDYDALPENGVARSLADPGLEGNYMNFIDDLNPMPAVDENLTEEARVEILNQTVRADAILAYMAAIKFADAQIGRFLDALEAQPDLYNNTIIILFSDHGFSLGEKKHWRKSSLWETDLRTPLLYIDLRHPEQQRSDRFVSLTDIFPTICSALEIPYPEFSDGSQYLDGKDLLPLITNPDTIWERPVIGTYTEKELSDQGGCFPQYSVRSDRFHYIKYQTNNVYGVLDCDITKSIKEEELYEIGLEREIDPYEWNNLAADENYLPVKQYLQQWLPDSNLYMRATYKAIIENNTLDCIAANDDTIHLSFALYDTNGTYLNVHPAELEYVWSTNINSTLYTGDEADLKINTFTEEELAAAGRLIVYLNIYDGEGHTVGFDMKYYYTGNSQQPVVSYNASANGMTACITDYNITGNYTGNWWDFGEGVIVAGDVPGPYTFSTAGSHTIKNYVQYGNGECIEIFEKTILTQEEVPQDFELFVYPNPADQHVTLRIDDAAGDGTMEIFNSLGQRMYAGESLQCGCTRFEDIDVSHMQRGFYIASFTGSLGMSSSAFVIER